MYLQCSHGFWGQYFSGWCFTHQYKNTTQFYFYAALLSSQNTNQQNMLYKDMFSGDLNSTSIENGVYSIGTLDAVKNAPTGVSWCTFIQLKPYTTQVILDTSGCYMRKYTGSPAKWSQWQAF